MIVRIDEKTLTWMINKTRSETPSVYNRAFNQKLKTKYIRTAPNGIIYLRTTSGTKSSKSYSQQFKFLKDFKSIKDHGSFNTYNEAREFIEQMINKFDVVIWCSDPSFKYWAWHYIATQNNASLRRLKAPNGGKPTRNNKALRGQLCKHLVTAIKTLPSFAPQIVDDLIRAKRIKIDNKETEDIIDS